MAGIPRNRPSLSMEQRIRGDAERSGDDMFDSEDHHMDEGDVLGDSFLEDADSPPLQRASSLSTSKIPGTGSTTTRQLMAAAGDMLSVKAIGTIAVGVVVLGLAAALLANDGEGIVPSGRSAGGGDGRSGQDGFNSQNTYFGGTSAEAFGLTPSSSPDAFKSFQPTSEARIHNIPPLEPDDSGANDIPTTADIPSLPISGGNPEGGNSGGSSPGGPSRDVETSADTQAIQLPVPTPATPKATPSPVSQPKSPSQSGKVVPISPSDTGSGLSPLPAAPIPAPPIVAPTVNLPAATATDTTPTRPTEPAARPARPGPKASGKPAKGSPCVGGLLLGTPCLDSENVDSSKWTTVYLPLLMPLVGGETQNAERPTPQTIEQHPNLDFLDNRECLESTTECKPAENVPFNGISHEDQAIYEVFFTNPDKCCGVAVEVGAGDGLMGSVSKYFEDALNWDVLLVEANPILYEKLKRNRPKAATVHGGFCTHSYMQFTTEGFKSIDVDEIVSEETAGTVVDVQTGMREVSCIHTRPMFRGWNIHEVDLMILRVHDALAVMRKFDWTIRVNVWVIRVPGSELTEHFKVVRNMLLKNEYVETPWEATLWCDQNAGCYNNKVFARKGFGQLSRGFDPYDTSGERRKTKEKNRGGLRWFSTNDGPPNADWKP